MPRRTKEKTDLNPQKSTGVQQLFKKFGCWLLEGFAAVGQLVQLSTSQSKTEIGMFSIYRSLEDFSVRCPCQPDLSDISRNG